MNLFVGTGPSSYKKEIYRAAVSQRLRNTELDYAVTGTSPATSTFIHSFIPFIHSFIQYSV